MSTASGKTKWYPSPPPLSPKVIHFPRSRRTRRRKMSNPVAANHHNDSLQLLPTHQKYHSHKENLENLFDRENKESQKAPAVARRERVEEEYEGGGGGGFEEEKWRFQAEILRDECNLLRMEREFALKKLEKNRVKLERTLTSAVQTLVSGKNKIFDGENGNMVLEEEIDDLTDKLEELKKSSKNKDYEARNRTNFDKKACVLQRQLENLGGLSNESHANIDIDMIPSSFDVDMLRKKMEGLSKGMLERVEKEYNSIKFSSSASTSKRMELSDLSNRQFYQEPPTMLHENKCSGRCKAVVKRIVDQVRSETEQWSQMQEMLAQVRGEMEDLQAARDFWENRAYNSDCEIQSLRHDVEEWKEKAVRYENKARGLQLELSIAKDEIQKSKSDIVPLAKQIEKEKKLVLDFRSKKGRKTDDEEQKERTPKKEVLQPLSLGKQLAKEKKMLLRRLKEHRRDFSERCGKKKVSMVDDEIVGASRSPLMDVHDNLSPLTRQLSRSAFGFFRSPESLRIREGFKKVINFH
ncbi:hypothetical protein CASFOL_010319 [Castilleja foliolosa]|uniref:Uncharacterized protein n=1 Tax=Castilleja foliolosa TaxID=1961234 RepID=A0ABD3DW00_9LAMI